MCIVKKPKAPEVAIGAPPPPPQPLASELTIAPSKSKKSDALSAQRGIKGLTISRSIGGMGGGAGLAIGGT